MHITEIEVQFGDCDPAGIVFYPNYFRWFDACFGGLTAAADLPVENRRRFPLVESGCKFLSPASVGDRLRVESSIVEIGRKIIRVSHNFFIGDTPVGTGWEVRVWGCNDPANPKKLKAEPIPDDVRNALARHIAA